MTNPENAPLDPAKERDLVHRASTEISANAMSFALSIQDYAHRLRKNLAVLPDFEKRAELENAVRKFDTIEDTLVTLGIDMATLASVTTPEES